MIVNNRTIFSDYPQKNCFINILTLASYSCLLNYHLNFRKEDEELTDKIKSLCASLSINNPMTGNFAVLLHVFIDKTETLLSSKEK